MLTHPQKGLVIPMSLVARSPQVVPNTVCQLLVKGMAVQPQQAETAQRAVAQASAESDEEDDEEEDVTGKPPLCIPIAVSLAHSPLTPCAEEESIAYVTSEIKSFLSSLLTQHFLSPAQHKLLLQLLEQNATLLFAAYSVALSAADSEYMAEICKDLGTSLQTQQGREACEAQDEVLQVRCRCLVLVLVGAWELRCMYWGSAAILLSRASTKFHAHPNNISRAS